jgi:ribonucleoside-diphosphate reductase beta chain
MYSVFNRSNNNALEEPMFLGNSVNVSRFDKQRYPFFEKLTEKQISFFWRPEEIDLAKDKIDFANLTPHEQHIFISNLKYQTLLDSVQGRSPNVVLLPLTSLPELETWIETWAFYETIHSRSYTHILRNIFTEPSEVLDDIMVNENILKRAEEVSKYYDDLYQYSLDYHKGEKVDLYTLKKKLYLCLMAVNALEGIRFYVSFACSFAFAERKMMEGNAKIIKLIARDEQLHLNGTQHILSLLAKEDPDFERIQTECIVEVYDMFFAVSQQEKDWVNYLFKDGSMLGMNEKMLCQYVDYITSVRMVCSLCIEELLSKLHTLCCMLLRL